MSKKDFAAMYWTAHAAGMAAGEAAVPVAMVVAEADAITGAAKAGGKAWYVSEGACGFAWIKIRGNTGFASWIKKHGKGRADSYAGGVRISVHEFGQSIARKEAYASAFAEVINGMGVTAYADSRLD